MSLNNLKQLVAGSVKSFKSLAPKRVMLLHHNDTDGLTAGAIISTCLERAGVSLEVVCLEKPYPLVMRSIFTNHTYLDALVITDFGSGMLSTLSDLNKHKIPILVVDHHGIEKPYGSSIILLNPLLINIEGTSISASALAFMFASEYQKVNQDLAHLGVLGVIGDRFLDAEGEFSDVVKPIAKKAETLGLIKRSANTITFPTLSDLEASKLVSCLDALGSFGYFNAGPDKARLGLLGGFNTDIVNAAVKLRAAFDQFSSKFLSELKLEQTGLIQWFDLQGSLAQYGVKSVGLLCETVANSVIANAEMYIAGFQHVPDQIPKLGQFNLKQSKISMRLPQRMLTQVKAGSRKPLTEILPQAVKKLGGFVDACHPHAAAATIEIGRERELIEEISKCC